MTPNDIATDVSTVQGTESVNISFCKSGNGSDVWSYD